MKSKKFLTSGCSFTFEEWNWPTTVSKYFNFELINVGLSCQGNGLISKKVIYNVNELLKENSNSDIIVGIMWSGIDRIDFYGDDIKIINNDGWIENPTSVTKSNDKHWIIGNYHWKEPHSLTWYKNFHTVNGMIILTLENI